MLELLWDWGNIVPLWHFVNMTFFQMPKMAVPQSSPLQDL